MSQRRIVAGQDTGSCHSVDTLDRDMETDLDRAEERRQVVTDTSLGQGGAAESSVVEAEHRAGAGVEQTAAEEGPGHTVQEAGRRQSVAEGSQALLPVQESK